MSKIPWRVKVLIYESTTGPSKVFGIPLPENGAEVIDRIIRLTEPVLKALGSSTVADDFAAKKTREDIQIVKDNRTECIKIVEEIIQEEKEAGETAKKAVKDFINKSTRQN